MVNINTSQRRRLSAVPFLDRYKPRGNLLKGGGGRHCSLVLLFYLFLFIILVMYNFHFIKRTLFPYIVQPNYGATSKENLAPLVWEWHRYSSTMSSSTTSPQAAADDGPKTRKKKLLIAQYVAPGKTQYSSILDASSPINRAYAKMYGYDYVLLRGIGMRVSSDTETHPPPPNRATFNKIVLLQHALSSGIYDQLLILDSDAVMYDFSKNVADFIPDDAMLVAHKVDPEDPPDTWHINIGVTLWNLRHPETKTFVDAWESRVKWWIWLDTAYAHTDQAGFHATLRLHSLLRPASPVLAIENEFRNGTIIHVMRPDCGTWVDVNATSRIDTIRNYGHEVCERYAPACENIDGIDDEPH